MHPYKAQPDRAFWKNGVENRPTRAVPDLWTPKFPMPENSRVASYGSCFAQHIGRALEERGLTWLRCESPPHGMRADSQARFGYGQFSSRTGNIYTASMLENWCKWALEGAPMPEEIWETETGHFDPLRPNLEPGGFATQDEVLAARKTTVAAFRKSILGADMFIFTLGLTERWVNRETGMEYQICPGTLAGSFDPDLHQFDNMDYAAVDGALSRAIAIMRRANPDLQILLTVSPVPLTATGDDKHVLVASTYSKSVLRAVAGAAAARDGIDYFPSYELITAPTMRGSLYLPNQRQVADNGVRFVMQHFFEAQGLSHLKRKAPQALSTLTCEEELLDAFGGAA